MMKGGEYLNVRQRELTGLLNITQSAVSMASDRALGIC